MKALTAKHLEHLKDGGTAAISAAYHQVYQQAMPATPEDWNLFIDYLDEAYPGWRGRPNPQVVWRPIRGRAN